MAPLPAVIEGVFGRLYGEPCWNVKRGHGSFLTLEFGEPYLTVKEPGEVTPEMSPVQKWYQCTRHVFVHGEWHLWIYLW